MSLGQGGSASSVVIVVNRVVAQIVTPGSGKLNNIYSFRNGRGMRKNIKLRSTESLTRLSHCTLKSWTRFFLSFWFLSKMARTWNEVYTYQRRIKYKRMSQLLIIFSYIFNALLSLWSSIIQMVDKIKGEWTRFGRILNDHDNLANGNQRIIKCDICCSYCCLCKLYNLWLSTLF